MKNIDGFISLLISLALTMAFQILSGFYFLDSIGEAVFISVVFLLIWNPIQYGFKQIRNKKKETL